jgi:erythronate-4-phosphate dehydrogenase
MLIIADDKIPFLRGVLDAHAEVRYLSGAKIAATDVRDADALLVRTRTRCDAALLAGSRIRFVATATIGFDHIDTAWCESNGIVWTSAPGCNSSSVQQYIASALLNLAGETGVALAGKTLGVIGVGNVGRKVAKLAEILGMKVLRNDPPRARAEGAAGFVSLDRLLAEADVVTLHVPLNKTGEDRTVRLADAGFLSRMKTGAWLINSSRGPVVDPAALKAALDSRHLAAAVLDVWDPEPEIDRDLLRRLRYATPHIAGYSTDGKANGTAMSVQALSGHFGLGLDAWYPAEILPPSAPVIRLPDGCWDEAALRAAVNATYDIRADDTRLRASPETFERQRGDYPLRREFPAFTVAADNLSPDSVDCLAALGFNTGRG